MQKDNKKISNRRSERATQESFRAGFAATQKGGVLAPDSAEQFVKGAFTKKPKDAATPKKVISKKPQQSTVVIQNTKRIPDKAWFTNPKTSKDFVFDAERKKWVSSDGSIVSIVDGAKQFNQAQLKDIRPKKEPRVKKRTNEGLSELAQQVDTDHEIQMARADLYKIAKYAIKLHEMMRTIPEEKGLEGWQQAKITKASDYISSVYHNLDYDMKFNGAGELGEGSAAKKKNNKKYKYQPAAKSNMSEADKQYQSSLSAKLKEAKKEQGPANCNAEVEIRDAKRANELAKDMFRGQYTQDGSNSFTFKDKDTCNDFKQELKANKIKLM